MANYCRAVIKSPRGTGLYQVLRFVLPISFSFSFRCAGVLANRRPVSLSIRFAYSRYEDSQRQ
jgi:hypothetical protein